MNYDGYTFRIIGYEGGYGTHNDFVVQDDEQTGDRVSDAIYRRNEKVKNLLNINITAEYGANIRDSVLRSVSADDDDFALVFIPGYEVMSSLSDNTYRELLSIDAVDWTKPWYNQSFVENLTVDGRLMFIDSAIQTQSANETSALLYNKILAEDYGLGDIYQTVRDGNWTLDLLYEYAEKATKDLDGDTVIDFEVDQCGLGGNSGLTYIFFKGAGGTFMEPDPDGGVKIVFGEEKNIDIMNDIMTRFSQKKVYADWTNEGTQKSFREGRMLFFNFGFGAMNWLRDMTFDYGVVPAPKRDAAQENYLCNVCYWGNSFMGIPKTADAERSAKIADVLSAESLYTVRDAYVENSIKYKYARSDEDTEMINLILDSRVYDIAVIYQLGGLSLALEQRYYEGKSDIASFYATMKDKVEKEVEDFVAGLGE